MAGVGWQREEREVGRVLSRDLKLEKGMGEAAKKATKVENRERKNM